MYSLIELKTLVSSGRDPARSLPLRRGFLLIPLILVCFAFSPQMQAQLPPEIPGNPDGCYPAFTTAEGCNALHQLFGGVGNTAIGWYSNFLAGDASFNTSVGAGTLALDSSLGASSNTAVGTAAMILNLSGNSNTAVGTNALVFNSVASFNNAVGVFALYNNDSSGAGSANGNNAFGAFALFSNITAGNNTAVGDDALGSNDNSGNGSGGGNTAVGSSALTNNIDGDSNTAVGAGALLSNTTSAGVSGISNNAVGRTALSSNTTGSFNEALGVNALGANTTSNQNVAIGDDALSAYTGPGTTAGGNTAVGGVALSALLTGTLNTAVGIGAGSADTAGETNNIYIGDAGASGDTDFIAIGAIPATGTAYTGCFIGGIDVFPQPPGGTVFDVTVNSLNHRLGFAPSSRRYKEDIKPMDNASQALFALKPVTFHYKKEIDPKQSLGFGLIAEDVAKVNPNFALYNAKGEVESINNRAIDAMLLNEFLREHKKVEEQQASIAELKSTVAQQQKGMEVLTTQLKEQAAQIQKVSAQVKVGKPAPQIAANEP
jgi:hypothetical protein